MCIIIMLQSHQPHAEVMQPEEEEDEIEDEAMDAMGITGFDKVEALARALINLEGISVTNSQAGKIKRLYDQLSDYDKKPVLFKPKSRTDQTTNKRKKSGHTPVKDMKRLVY